MLASPNIFPGKQGAAMAFVSQLLLLLSCIICHALIASAAGEQSYKILSTSSLKPQAVCSEPKGTQIDQ